MLVQVPWSLVAGFEDMHGQCRRNEAHVLVLQGLPLGSGLGSSAASAAAAAGAVNALFGDALTRQELVLPGLCSEAAVSGYHADNIAPSILGGFVLIRYSLEAMSQRIQYAQLHYHGGPSWAKVDKACKLFQLGKLVT